MHALTRFVQNAGAANSGRFLLVMVILCFALAKDLKIGLIPITLPLALFGLLAPRLVRDWLIDHFETLKVIMNLLVILGVVVAAYIGKSKSTEPESLRIGLCAVFSLYLGVYFWVLSDARIQRS